MPLTALSGVTAGAPVCLIQLSRSLLKKPYAKPAVCVRRWRSVIGVLLVSGATTPNLRRLGELKVRLGSLDEQVARLELRRDMAKRLVEGHFAGLDEL